MGIYALYYRYLRLRLRWRFFALMPEVPLIRLAERLYISWYHRAELSRARRNPGNYATG